MRIDYYSDEEDQKSEESEKLYKAPSMVDQVRGVPCMNTTQSSCSPLLLDVKAHQGRQMI